MKRLCSSNYRSIPRSSLDHPRNAKEGLGSVRGLRQNGVRNVARNQHVVTEFRMVFPGCSKEDLRHGLDVCDVELLEFADVGEDLIKLPAIELDFLGRQLEVRKLGDSQNVFTADRH